jgi:hypothetical protein
MIEYEQRGWRNEGRVRHTRLLARVLRQLFEEAHDIVSGHADETASERQIVGRLWLRRLCKCSTQCVEVLLLVLRPGARLAVNQQAYRGQLLCRTVLAYDVPMAKKKPTPDFGRDGLLDFALLS